MEHPVRIILKKTTTVSVHGEGVQEDFMTVDINSKELERAMVDSCGMGQATFKVIGAELINEKEAAEKAKTEWHNKEDLSF